MALTSSFTGGAMTTSALYPGMVILAAPTIVPTIGKTARPHKIDREINAQVRRGKTSQGGSSASYAKKVSLPRVGGEVNRRRNKTDPNITMVDRIAIFRRQP
jgi:hypothetical protein